MNFEDGLNEEYENIKNKLIDMGYANKSINYIKFLEIYEPYKNNFTEKEFGKIIGLSNSMLHDIKYKNLNAIILKVKITFEREKQIKEELIVKGYANKKINYAEYLKMYEPYEKEVGEKQFLKILGISERRFYDVKEKGASTFILKQQITKKMKDDIKKELLADWQNASISNEEFETIYEKYKYICTEETFADILGISQYNFEKMKNEGQKVTILKKALTEEEIINLRNEIIKDGYSNCSLNRETFLNLFKKYGKGIDLKDFCNVLKINYDSYIKLINNVQNAVILKSETQTKISNLFKEARFYSKEELLNLLANEKFSLHDLFRYDYQAYKEKMELDGEIFVGKIDIPEPFLLKNLGLIINYLKQSILLVSTRLNEDVILDKVYDKTFDYIIKTKGSAVLNFNEEKALQILKKQISHAVYKIASIELYQQTKNVVYYENEIKPEYNLNLRNDLDIENIICQNDEKDSLYESYLKSFKIYLTIHNDEIKAIESMAHDLKMSKKELLELIKDELILNNKIKESKDKVYYIK
jgi:hypothetical protein